MDKLTEKWLKEAITFSPEIKGKHIYNKAPPLKDTEVIRVYHGFYNNHHAYQFCKYGASGKELASRVYSYERNNNPYGLFVTSQFKTAKEFSRESDGLAIIIEFHAKVKDLEAPVWPSGRYTVQGDMAQSWKGDGRKDQMADRERGRLKTRDDIKKSNDSDLDFAKKSDRPELAQSLFDSREYQALFVGDLDPNMIRAVWVYEGKNSPQLETFKRITRQEFLNSYKRLDNEKPRGNDDHPADKVYIPNEDWKGMDDFVKRYVKKSECDEEAAQYVKDFIVDAMKTEGRKRDLIFTIKKNLWPKQLKQAIQDLGIDDKDYF